MLPGSDIDPFGAGVSEIGFRFWFNASDEQCQRNEYEKEDGHVVEIVHVHGDEEHEGSIDGEEDAETKIGGEGRGLAREVAEQQYHEYRSPEQAIHFNHEGEYSFGEVHDERGDGHCYDRHRHANFLAALNDGIVIEIFAEKGFVDIEGEDSDAAVENGIEGTEDGPENNGSEKADHEGGHDVAYQRWVNPIGIFEVARPIQVEGDDSGHGDVEDVQNLEERGDHDPFLAFL